ncbi:hypothetical protein [Pseudofrankia inefficax]|uniref:Uncharacterized protein n=1 Tax=Pseudofrankia inefficax (strain DSM 45817 / CECT 9037 / DDB 130130 / EuI1c) TaxID=298654 RepID=E3J1J4_PSEI1|nr:hypothetical protein [Pseudofrankia inefficax]ADP81662.1 hypothetical protein FraEuI1c_3655 [Pseudofrankia inefficax]
MSLTDSDLRTWLRALPDELPQRDFGPGPDAVRSGARRRRARARAAGVVALVVLVAAGVGVPVGLHAAGGDGNSRVVSARPAVSTAGGFTLTWLPDGLTHSGDAAASRAGTSGFDWGLVDGAGRPLPPGQAARTPLRLLSLLAARTDPTKFGALFTATGGHANPSTVTVTVTWQPTYAMNIDALRANVTPQSLSGYGPVGVTADTVGGRPALVLRHDTATDQGDGLTAPAVPAAARYQLALLWVDATGVVLTVDLAGPSPPDVAVAHRIAGGIVLGTMPPLVGYTPPGVAPAPVDAVTAAAVTAAIDTAYTGGVPDDRWAAAVQDGPRLVAVRAKTRQLFPGLMATLQPAVDTLSRVDANTVRASVALAFSDPNVSIAAAPAGLRFAVTVVHTAAGWQVTRASYCANVDQLGVSALSLAC